jgi:hypothetical protein
MNIPIIEILDKNLVHVFQVPNETINLTINDVLNDVGDFNLKLAPNTKISNYLLKEKQVFIQVKITNKTIFTGIIEEVRQSINSDSAVLELEFTGKSIICLLNDKIVFGDPKNEITNQHIHYDREKVKAAVENHIKYFINYNAGVNALPSRKGYIDNFIDTKPVKNIGDSVIKSDISGNNLLELIKEFLDIDGTMQLTYEVNAVQRKIYYDVVYTTDKTDSIILDVKLNSIISAENRCIPASVNTIYSMGSYDDDDNNYSGIRVQTDNSKKDLSVYGRLKEKQANQATKDETQTALKYDALNDEALKELNENGYIKNTLTAEPKHNKQFMEFFTDYNLGDIVSMVDFSGNMQSIQITKYSFSIDNNGYNIAISTGNDESNIDTKILTKIKKNNISIQKLINN